MDVEQFRAAAHAAIDEGSFCFRPVLMADTHCFVGHQLSTTMKRSRIEMSCRLSSPDILRS